MSSHRDPLVLKYYHRERYFTINTSNHSIEVHASLELLLYVDQRLPRLATSRILLYASFYEA